MEQTTGGQPLMNKQSTIGSIFIFMGFLFFYIALKYMIIPMGFISIPGSNGSWIYQLFG